MKTSTPLMLTGNKQLDEMLRALWGAVFGLTASENGNLDVYNVPGVHDGTIGGHSNIIQGDDIDDSSSSNVQVNNSDADASYSSNEQDLINELKKQINILAYDLNMLISKHNAHLGEHRSQKLFK